MKTFAIVIILFFCFYSHSQDTIYSAMLPQGGMVLHIIDHSDTFAIQTYPNGAISSKMRLSSLKPNQRYIRYYPNGNLMWEKSFEYGKTNGRAKYFSEGGKLVADFRMEADTIVDTLYLSKKHYILFGKASFSSTVYGGMEREDGTSNVSHVEGPYNNYTFYTVKLDSTKKIQKIYKEFITDQYGQFFLCLEAGKFGFFPGTYPVDKVGANDGTPMEMIGSGSQSGWNLESPLIIDVPGIYSLEITMSSVGYAP